MQKRNLMVVQLLLEKSKCLSETDGPWKLVNLLIKIFDF